MTDVEYYANILCIFELLDQELIAPHRVVVNGQIYRTVKLYPTKLFYQVMAKDLAQRKKGRRK